MCTTILVVAYDPTMPMSAIIWNVQVVDVEPHRELSVQLLCKIKRYLVATRITTMCT